MIFSTSDCPLCGKSLELKVDDKGPPVLLRYECVKQTSIYSLNNRQPIQWSHYTNSCYKNGDMSSIFFEDLCTINFEDLRITRLYRNIPKEPLIFIYEIPLLDMDYTKPQDVASRLKRLVAFS